MLSKKLQDLLGTLQKNEIEEFKLFLNSKYFNRFSNGELLLEIFGYLEKYNFDFSLQSLSKRSVYEHLFPDEAFVPNKKSKLDNLTTNLFYLLKKFLAQVEFEKEESFNVALSLTKHYRLNGLHQRFEQSVESLKKILNSYSHKHSKYYYNFFQVENEISNYLGARNIFNQENLDGMEKSLDMFYCLWKYEHLIHLKLRTERKGIGYPESKVVEDFLNYLSDIYNNGDSSILEIYNLILANISSPSFDLLKKYSELLPIVEPGLPEIIKKDFRALRRIFISKINYQRKDSELLRLNFEVLKQDLLDGYLYYNNKINVNAFRNIIPLGLKHHQVDWVKNFLDAHPPERLFGTRFPKELHSLKTAEYLFYLGKYSDALDRLEYRPFDDPHNSLLLDVLFIRIYFETQNDLIDFKLRSFEQKIRRAELSDQAKSLYFNFFKKVDKIYRYGGIAKNKKKLEKVHYDLLYLPNIVEREWLIEKTEEALGYTPKHEDKEK